MPVLNFKKQFAPYVESGKKLQTIRARRKDGRDPKPGQILYHYTGMRTNSCRKLREDICKESLPIYMDRWVDGLVDVFVNGSQLDEEQIYSLALADGFTNTDDFFAFFSDRMPFDGFIIKW